MGVAKRKKDSAGAERLDPSVGGEEEDEVTPLGSRPGPVHQGGGVCLRAPHCAAPASPNPRGPLPLYPLFPVSAGRSPPWPPPRSSRPGRSSLSPESGQGRRELTLPPSRAS